MLGVSARNNTSAADTESLDNPRVSNAYPVEILERMFLYVYSPRMNAGSKSKQDTDTPSQHDFDTNSLVPTFVII
jgi:hypothetical protein